MKLREMTMSSGSMENLGKYLKDYEHILKDSVHVGDIEDFNVFRKERNVAPFYDYAISTEDKIIAFFSVTKKWEVDIAYVSPEFRKKGLFSAFLFFLKRNEGASKITLGNVHSQDTIDAIKRIHARFDTHWENQKTKEKIKYDPNTAKDFYGVKSSNDWRIILENDSDFSDWPKFYPKDFPDLKTFYFNLLEDI